MRSKALAVVGLLLGTALFGCGGPFVLLPGGALEGETAPAPESWASTEDVQTIQLETNPADPYSVNIWVVGLEDRLYVHAGTNHAKWIENMETDPNVRLRVTETIYELTASRVEDQKEFDRFSDAYEEKYGRRPGNEDATEAYLFRLVARS